MSDELGNGFDWKRWIDHHDQRNAHDRCNRRDILDEIEDSLEHGGQYPLANGVGTDWLAVAEYRRLGVAARGQLPRNGERTADERHALIAPHVLHAGLPNHP